jgi:hypothetical protein
MEGMIQNMELAFRMQTTQPQLVDLSEETQGTLDVCGIGRTRLTYNQVGRDFRLINVYGSVVKEIVA